MVSVGVSRMGKTSVVFVEPGAKVNSEYYCDHVLRQGLLPNIRARCNRHNWTLQQDGAPSHTARNTINFLHQENETFIEPDMWPPNSLDLNPVDYAIWGALQQKVYRRRKFPTIEQLKLAIIEEWQNLSQRFINRSIDVAQTFGKKCWEPRRTHWIWFLILDKLTFSNNLLAFLDEKL